MISGAVCEKLADNLRLVEFAGRSGFLWCRSNVGVAGLGVARRVWVEPDAREELSAIVGRELEAFSSGLDGLPPGVGPVAFMSLPFGPDEPATFVIPRVAVRCSEDGSVWRTDITAGGDELPEVEQSCDAESNCEAELDSEPNTFRVSCIDDPQQWRDALFDARSELQAGVAHKVVLARAVEVYAERPIRQDAVLEVLNREYGGCIIYSVDGFVGASPELLVSRLDDVVRAHPMAGTRPRGHDPQEDALIASGLLCSDKDRREHQITIDAVIDSLLDYCSYLDAEPEPSIVSMRNVSHLASIVEGRLHLPVPSILELVHALHPTPAVCGEPRQAALEMIRKYEPRPRGPYAGPVGWVDAAGNGEFAVGIRGAQINGTRAEIWAGVGVLADSDPDAELAETEAKLAAMLGAVTGHP